MHRERKNSIGFKDLLPALAEGNASTIGFHQTKSLRRQSDAGEWTQTTIISSSSVSLSSNKSKSRGSSSTASLPLGYELRASSKFNPVAQAMEKYPAVITHGASEEEDDSASSMLSSTLSLLPHRHARPLFVREIPAVPISLRRRLESTSNITLPLPETMDSPKRLQRQPSWENAASFAKEVQQMRRPSLCSMPFQPSAALLEMPHATVSLPRTRIQRRSVSSNAQ